METAKTTIDEITEEVKRVGKDAMALLRSAQDIDATLAGLPKTDANRQARAALLERRDSFQRQRHTLLARQKELNRQRQLEKHEVLFGDAPSITVALRESARRVGIIEHLYCLLSEHLNDGPESDFDWRIPVRATRRKLNDDADGTND